MPIYEYRCNDCEKTFEVIRKFSDGPVKKCAYCQGVEVEKLISQSSFILKGGGWCQDGYADKDKKERKEETASAPKPDCSSCPSSSSN